MYLKHAIQSRYTILVWNPQYILNPLAFMFFAKKKDESDSNRHREKFRQADEDRERKTKR